MADDTLLPLALPEVRREKVTAAFNGGMVSSNDDLPLLRGAERRMGLADLPAGLRDPVRAAITPGRKSKGASHIANDAEPPHLHTAAIQDRNGAVSVVSP